ncbi:MAG TPA: tetratricopeptide repeat protein, partial [Herpetosiphonaceae bacterium]
MDAASIFIPIDRRLALAGGRELPERSHGAALFADISGFTPLTEALAQELGAKGGPEAVTHQLNIIYTAVIQEIERFGGSVIGFAGDSITCWFDGDVGWRALSSAVAIQAAMREFAVLETPAGKQIELAIKVAVAVGPVRRFLVGDPAIQYIDALAGATLDRMARAEQLAGKGEIVASAEVAEELGARLAVAEWRAGPDGGRFAVIASLEKQAPARSWPALEPGALTVEQVRPWLLAPVYQRIAAGQSRFLAELRPVVAMFIRFGGIAYDSDPQAGRLLDSLIRWIQQVLTRYDGALLQLVIGDKGSYVYGTFGAPLANDDDEVRAIAAALDLLHPPAELGQLARLQIGLSRGRMRAGAYGSPTCRTYSVLGDDVNLAARLMQSAAPGQVLVSQAMIDAADYVYQFKSIGLVELKGKSQAIPVAAVLGRRQAATQRPISLFPTPLMGRDAELAILGQALAPTLAGRGQVLRLEGPAGLGKSHLSAEFAERAAEAGLRLTVGTCLSTSQDVAYTPWRQILRDLCGLADDAPGEDPATADQRQVSQLEGFIRELNPAWLLRLPLLGDLLQLPVPENPATEMFDPRLRQEALIALTIDLLQVLAARQPLLLLLEDVHWIDEASERLTLALGRALADNQLLLLIVHRPPLSAGQPILAELDRLPHHRRLELGELGAEGIDALMRHQLGGPPAPLTLEVIQALAQGNPFFTEELVATLREAGRLAPLDDGSWGLTPPMVEALQAARCLTRQEGALRLLPDAQLSGVDLGIPDSIHGIVLSRLDRLPESHKLTLKVASVIGRIFRLELLAQAHPLRPSGDEVLDQITMLEDRDFARLELPAPWLAYMFKHSITQQVAYGTLLESQQRELHRLVGESLERLEPEAIDQLAYHFSRSDQREKTLRYLDAAALKAQREYLNETALEYYSQALGLESSWRRRQGQIEILHALGRREEELAALRRLDEDSECPPFESAYLWSGYYEALGEYAQAGECLDRALAAASAQGDFHSRAKALMHFGLVAWRQGSYEQAAARYMEALEAFPDPEHPSHEEQSDVIFTLNGLGTAYRQQSDFEAARMCYDRALQISRQSANLFGEATALNHLGGLTFYQRNFPEALSHYQQSLGIRRTSGDRAGEGACLYNLASAYRDAGDYERAGEHFLAALAILQDIGDRWEEANLLNGLGGMHKELGNLEEAERYMRQGLRLTEEIGDVAGKAYQLVNLGLVMSERDDYGAARQMLEEGLRLATDQNDKFLVSAFFSYLGGLYLRMGDSQQALDQAQAALKLREEMDLLFFATGDLATSARALVLLGKAAEAEAAARRALGVLDSCG